MWSKPLGNSTLTITHYLGQDAKTSVNSILHKRHSESDEAGSIFWHENWEPTRGILGSRAPFWWSIHLHQNIANMPVTSSYFWTSQDQRTLEPFRGRPGYGVGPRQKARLLSSQKMRWGKTREERSLGEERDREREREVGLPQSGPSQEKPGFNHCLEKWATLSESLSPLCRIRWKSPALSKKWMESALQRAK